MIYSNITFFLCPKPFPNQNEQSSLVEAAHTCLLLLEFNHESWIDCKLIFSPACSRHQKLPCSTHSIVLILTFQVKMVQIMIFFQVCLFYLHFKFPKQCIITLVYMLRVTLEVRIFKHYYLFYYCKIKLLVKHMKNKLCPNL